MKYRNGNLKAKYQLAGIESYFHVAKTRHARSWPSGKAAKAIGSNISSLMYLKSNIEK